MSDREDHGPVNRVYLSLGSNIGPKDNLPAAVRLLARFGRVLAVSTVWESRPLGCSSQPNYLNAAVLLETTMTAPMVRDSAITAIETELGRVRTADKNAPRTIDIDIMLFNREIIRVGNRRIPDPEIGERPFVAIPLAEIDPDYVHPETGEALRDIARRFDPLAFGMRPRFDVVLKPESGAILNGGK